MTPEFDAAIAEVRGRDPRFTRDAYVFVFEALAHTQRQLDRPHHVSGGELLDGIRALAAAQFGFLAKTVFNEWGLTGTADFGRVVFNLVDANLMGKQDTDALADFADRYDFAEAFEQGFTLDGLAPAAAGPPDGGEGLDSVAEDDDPEPEWL
jgi:uncharacterized repeat protein (TIGR04138 family)